MGDMMTYNPAFVKVALGTHAVTGYAEDSFIVVEPLGDGVTSKAGCDGEIVRSVDPNNRFSLKISLLASSPTKPLPDAEILAGQKGRKREFPGTGKGHYGRGPFFGGRRMGNEGTVKHEREGSSKQGMDSIWT